MKRTTRLALGLLFVAAVWQTSSVYAGVRIGIGIPFPIFASPPPPTVVYAAPPPAPVYVAPPLSPGPSSVWVPGEYQWNGSQWVWYPGYYSYPPYAGAVWVGGCWGNYGGSRVWVGGHWGHHHH